MVHRTGSSGRPSGSTACTDPRSPSTIRQGYAFAPDFSLMVPVAEMPSSDWFLNQGRESYEPRWGPVWPMVHQKALFRREEGGLLTLAAAPRLAASAQDSVAVAVTTFTEGDTAGDVIEGGGAGATRRFLVAGVSEPRLVSVEALAADGSGAARARMAVQPPGASTAEPGLSDIMLVAWDSATVASLDSAFPRMLAATKVLRAEPVGVYWEVYGAAAGEAVSITLAVASPEERAGLLRGLGQALGLVKRPPSIRLNWSFAAEGPITGRILRLDLSQLPPGLQQIQVEAVVGERPAVSVTRSIETYDGGTP